MKMTVKQPISRSEEKKLNSFLIEQHQDDLSENNCTKSQIPKSAFKKSITRFKTPKCLSSWFEKKDKKLTGLKGGSDVKPRGKKLSLSAMKLSANCYIHNLGLP